MNLDNILIDFYFEQQGVLNYRFNIDEQTNTGLVDEGVLIYAYELVDFYTVHLVYLLKGGEFIYSIYKDNSWTKALIGKFDTLSNYYAQLEILLINNKLHIFYSFANYINSNIFTLHHVIYNNKIDQGNNIIRYISKKSRDSFNTKKDSNGNIHLLYNTIVGNFSSINYTHYNPFSNRWLANPIKLSKDGTLSESPHIFVDSKDNVHSFWWEKTSKGYDLKYNRMSSIGKEKFKWVEIKIPRIISESTFTNVIENDDSLKLIYDDYNNGLTKFIISKDFGITWESSNEKKLVQNTSHVVEIEDLKVKNQEIFDFESKNLLLEQLLLNQKEIKLILNNVLEEQLFIKQKVIRLEEKNSKSSFISRIFNSD